MKVFLSLEILLFIFFIFCRILSGVGWSDVIWFGLAALSDSRLGRAGRLRWQELSSVLNLCCRKVRTGIIKAFTILNYKRLCPSVCHVMSCPVTCVALI